MTTYVTSQVLEWLRAEAEEHHPKECCGLLIGDGSLVDEAWPARNVALFPEQRFEIDPQVLVEAFRAERAGGFAIMGYYHSHPSGDPTPSATDRAEAPGDDKVWVIIGKHEFGFWRDGPRGLKRMWNSEERPLIPFVPPAVALGTSLLLKGVVADGLPYFALNILLTALALAACAIGARRRMGTTGDWLVAAGWAVGFAGVAGASHLPPAVGVPLLVLAGPAWFAAALLSKRRIGFLFEVFRRDAGLSYQIVER